MCHDGVGNTNSHSNTEVNSNLALDRTWMGDSLVTPGAASMGSDTDAA